MARRRGSGSGSGSGFGSGRGSALTGVAGAGFALWLVACGGAQPPPQPPPPTADTPAGPPSASTTPCTTDALRALSHHYEETLAHASGQRTAAPVRQLVAASIGDVVRCGLDATTVVDTQLVAVDLLAQMQDVRSLPALLRVLAWETDAHEELATLAARGIRSLRLDAAARGAAVDAVGGALDRVHDGRGIDNRLRIECLRTLGGLHDPRATPVLVRVAMRRDPAQNFLINRLAVQQLGALGDPASVPTLIRALYAFAPESPQMRMNDAAAEALVAIGRPALAPLLDTLAGRNTEAHAVAAEYVAAAHAQMPDVHLDARAVVSNEAAYALGQLGFREAIDPLVAEATQLDRGESPSSIETDPDDAQRELGAALALVYVARGSPELPRVRAALVAAYRRVEETSPSRLQLVVAMQHLFDPGLASFFLEVARPGRREVDDVMPDLRVVAFRAAMRLAAPNELAPLEQLLADERDEAMRMLLAEHAAPAVLEATRACGTAVACWAQRLASTNPRVVLKAQTMLARYGRGDAAAVAALVASLDLAHDSEVVAGALDLLDVIATSGSPAAVARIDALRESGEGTAAWSHVESMALMLRARLSHR